MMTASGQGSPITPSVKLLRDAEERRRLNRLCEDWETRRHAGRQLLVQEINTYTEKPYREGTWKPVFYPQSFSDLTMQCY